MSPTPPPGVAMPESTITWCSRCDDGHRIVYNDPRRFGIMDIIVAGSPRRIPLLAHLGVEPLGNAFDAWHLWRAFRGKRAPLKAALLDQRIIAGLGNIYVCEALHRARLSPLRLAGTLARRRKHQPDERLERLVTAVRAGPDRGHRGRRLDLARLCPHRRHGRGLPDGFRGLRPRGRALPAAGCRGRIRRTVQAGRSTFWCPVCQR
jgi:formamidopyrimidine-DNA glycosylase